MIKNKELDKWCYIWTITFQGQNMTLII